MNQSARILIVDDDPFGTQLLITLLGFEGYQGFRPDELANPLASVEQHRPDLVIMDVRLRSLDGVALLQQLRSLPDPDVATTPVLLLCALMAVTALLRFCWLALPPPVV